MSQHKYRKHDTWLNEERSIIKAMRKKKANWIGCIFRKDCLQVLVIEGKIEGRR